MSENNHTNDNHVGVLHPSRPMNHEPESNESRSTVGNGPNEDEDVTLAKILQEQERAFLELRGMSTLENVPPRMSSGEEEAEGPSDVQEESMTDEQLAWKLMQEEEHAFQERMMAMAGLTVPNMDNGQERQEAADEEAIDPDTLTYEELTTLGEMAGTVAAGISEEQLKKLPVKLYGEVEGHDDPCVVCQLDFEPSDNVIELPCRHVYHPDCIHPWLTAKKTCPHCSQEVV